jgi:hypothetical protein
LELFWPLNDPGEALPPTLIADQETGPCRKKIVRSTQARTGQRMPRRKKGAPREMVRAAVFLAKSWRFSSAGQF